ncbi:ShlB/FhaC/HecB family hemolysin secretion/activation protein [Nodosilinea sp. P-1105]|uniref:ShlB/FhaC/HecB family hemolysin secretion/activation protein n=1 Tax=Nodosilinea sp. P-1105 TaxID=2546229 RepID=UPI001469C423|nr:ShlB/FhaC/HecB family hemolysin secretion/activation protein [Nodosilinea sp. P-1105]NMF85008.1 ShlB/FhaC/HecB family hemolysin secretion/activation protein [Nodosilinea sp. P-1105]
MRLPYFLLGLIPLLFPLSVEAQPMLPSTDDPSRIEQDIPPVTPPDPAADIVIPETEDLEPPAGADEQLFVLEQLTVEGITVYDEAEIAELFEPLLGIEISLADLYAIANDLTALYREDGYLLSRVVVPAQTVEAGQVRLQAIEGYIESVELDDAAQERLSPRLQRRVLRYARRLEGDAPLNSDPLERYLLLINDLAGVTLKSTLGPGSVTGATRLVLSPTYAPVNATLGINNRGSNTTGPLRVQGGVFLNSLLGEGELLSLTGTITPQNFSQLGSLAAGVRYPVGDDGLQLGATFSYTTVEPGGELQAFGVDGESYSAELAAIYPLQRSRQQNLSLWGSLEAISSTTQSTFTGAPAILSQDRLRVARVGLQGDRQDASGLTLGRLVLSQGLGGSSGAPDRPLSRAQGSTGFTSLKAEVTRRQQLPAGFALEAGAIGQVATTSLLVPEQFGLGGSRYGRAFVPSQLLGDAGYGLRLELQRPISYTVAGLGDMVTQPHLFLDYGQVFRYTPTAAENASDALSSVGVGVRHQFEQRLLGELELAVPLSKTDTGLSNNSPRVYFNLQAFF